MPLWVVRGEGRTGRAGLAEDSNECTISMVLMPVGPSWGGGARRRCIARVGGGPGAEDGAGQWYYGCGGDGYVCVGLCGGSRRDKGGGAVRVLIA